MLKIIEEQLELEDQLKEDNVQGPKGSTPTAQAPPRRPTPTSTLSTTTHAGTLEVDSVLRDMATTEGSRRVVGGNADVNDKDPNSSF